ncbi:hypothetical protein ED733_001433 [Metarhizium rileyi]|uniref:Uncharacterized protein n=1 Tax=Metarhizium rileyi (strain RCEF 4871) TaxID=1649241 RepID=A0A5C6G1F4_METRR|nr:hypothetical protein ED733_001433 [Metarhizium rileyi]
MDSNEQSSDAAILVVLDLTRAALRLKRVVILDEATSRETEKRMHCIIKEDFAGRTIMATTHVLQSSLYFDTVAVIKKEVIA